MTPLDWPLHPCTCGQAEPLSMFIPDTVLFEMIGRSCDCGGYRRPVDTPIFTARLWAFSADVPAEVVAEMASSRHSLRFLNKDGELVEWYADELAYQFVGLPDDDAPEKVRAWAVESGYPSIIKDVTWWQVNANPLNLHRTDDMLDI